MFGMAKPPRPPWWPMFITLVLQSSLLIIINHDQLVGVNGQQEHSQQEQQQETTKPGSFVNPITVFTIGNSTVSSTIVADQPTTTMAGPHQQQQHLQSEQKIDEKLCQISDTNQSSTGFNSSTHKLNVASNCKTLVHKSHHQQNLDSQQSMVLEVFYNPKNNSNNPMQPPIRFQINSSSNQTALPFNLTNKIISPHSLNVKTSPNGEITVINGKTVTSILYEQDRSAIQKLVNAKLAQPPTSSTLPNLSSTPATTVMTTMKKPESASTTIAAASSSSSTLSTPMPSTSSTMAPALKNIGTESNGKKQSILIDHHKRSSSVPGVTFHTQGDNNAHNHNYNNAHNHNYNTHKNNEANINYKYEMMFNRKNVHSYLNRVANQQQRTWALNSIQNHHKHSPQAFGSKISGKTTMQPGEGVKVTTQITPTDHDDHADNSTSNTATTTTIRDKNRIDYLRQRYNKSVAKMNQTTTATTATTATTSTSTSTPTMIATAASSSHNDETSAIMSNLATMMTTPDHESPVPVYFTTTKPLFRPNNVRHHQHHNHGHRNQQQQQQKSKQKFVVHSSNSDGEINDEIDEILLLNSTTSKPIMDIKRLRPAKPLRSSSKNSQQPSSPQKPKQQPLVPMRRPEIKWRPFYHRTKNATRTLVGEKQLGAINTSLATPQSTTPPPKVLDSFVTSLPLVNSNVGQPSLQPPPTMVNVTVDKEEEKTMMFLPIKTGGQHVKHQTRPHRPQLTEPYEYPLMNFEDEMLHLHHPPLLKASMAASGSAFPTPRSTMIMDSLSPQEFFQKLASSDGGDKKSASSTNHVLQDSMIPAGLGLEQHHFPEKNMLMSELFDRKFNLINEIYRKKSNDPNMIVQPLVRTSADLIRMAAMKPQTSSSSSSSSSLTNQIHPNNSIKSSLISTTTLAGTVAPPLAALQTAVTTPMPPPEVYVTIENKFYVLRNNTATVHHPIQDLNTVDDKDIVPLLAPSATPITASGTPPHQQPSISIVPSAQASKSHHASIQSGPTPNLHHRFNPMDAANYFSSQRIPSNGGNGEEKIHHPHQQQQLQQQRHQSQHHPAEEFPETLMQFMQKYNHHQQHPITIDAASSGKKHHPQLLSGAGGGAVPGQYPFIPTIYGNNRRPLPVPSRVNKFNNLLLNEPAPLISESISGGLPQPNILDSSFNHRHHMSQHQQHHLDNGGETRNSNNNNPYTLVRHYIQTYFPDKAEIGGLAQEHPGSMKPSLPMHNGNVMFWPMSSPTMLKADTMPPSPPIKPNLYNGGGEDSQETPTNLNQIISSEDPLSVAMMLVSTGPNRYTDHNNNGLAGQTQTINNVSNDGIDGGSNKKIPAPPRRRPSFDFETREQARLKQWSISNAAKTGNNGISTNQIIGGVDHHHHHQQQQQSQETWSSSSSSSSAEQQGPSLSTTNDNKMIFDDDGQPELVFTSAEIDNGKMDFRPSSSMIRDRNKRPLMIDQDGQDGQQTSEESNMMIPSNGNGNSDNNNNKLGSMEDELLWKTMAQTPDPFDEFYDRDRSFMMLPLNNNSLIDYSDIQWKPAASNQMEITSLAEKNHNNNNNVTIVDQKQQQQQSDEQQQPRPQLLPDLMIMDKGIDSNNLNGNGNGNGNGNSNNNGNSKNSNNVGGGWGHPPKLSKLSELLSLNGLFNAIQNHNVKSSLNQTQATTKTKTLQSNSMIGNHNPNHHPHLHAHQNPLLPHHHLPNPMNDEVYFKRQPLSLATMLVPSTAGRDVLVKHQYGLHHHEQPSSLLLPTGKKQPATTIKTIANGPQTTAVTKLMASFSARPLQPTSAISSLNIDDELENNELIHKIGAKFSVSGNPTPQSSLPSAPPIPTSLSMANHPLNLHHEEPQQLIGDLHYDVVPNLMDQPQAPSFPPLWESSSMLNNQVALPYLTIEPNTNRIRKNRVLKNMKLLIKAINRIYRI